MPFIEAELNQDYENKPVAEGSYRLRVKEFDAEAVSKKGGAMYKYIVEIVASEDGTPVERAAPINGVIMKPDGGDYDDMRMRDLKRFLALFSVPFEGNGFDTDDVAGSEAVGLVTVEHTDEYGDQNRLRFPRVDSEAAPKKSPRRR